MRLVTGSPDELEQGERDDRDHQHDHHRLEQAAGDEGDHGPERLPRSRGTAGSRRPGADPLPLPPAEGPGGRGPTSRDLTAGSPAHVLPLTPNPSPEGRGASPPLQRDRGEGQRLHPACIVPRLRPTRQAQRSGRGASTPAGGRAPLRRRTTTGAPPAPLLHGHVVQHHDVVRPLHHGDAVPHPPREVLEVEREVEDLLVHPVPHLLQERSRTAGSTSVTRVS